MTEWNWRRDRAVRPGLAILRPHSALVLFVGAVAAGFLAIVSLVPPLAVVPVVSLAAIAAAAVVALFAWYRGAERASSNITSWDVAGALAFLGFSAGILSGPEQVLQLFGHATMAR